jgi:hypothetical protein
LARLYLAEYSRRGGTSPPLATFLEEIYALWLVAMFSMLRWYLHETLDDPWERTRRGDEDYRRESCEQLRRHLSILLTQAP